MHSMFHCKCVIIILLGVIAFLYSRSLSYNKNVQCVQVYYNINMSWYLCIRMDFNFFVMQHHCDINNLEWVSFFSFLFVPPPFGHLMHQNTVTYSIVNFFLCMISKMMINCSYEGDKLLSKVMTMFSFLTSTSKWFDLANVVQQIKPSCNLHVNKLLLMNQILDKLPIL